MSGVGPWCSPCELVPRPVTVYQDEELDSGFRLSVSPSESMGYRGGDDLLAGIVDTETVIGTKAGAVWGGKVAPGTRPNHSGWPNKSGHPRPWPSAVQPGSAPFCQTVSHAVSTMSLLRSTSSVIKRSGTAQPAPCRAFSSSGPSRAKPSRQPKPKAVKPDQHKPQPTADGTPRSAFAAYQQAAAKASASTSQQTTRTSTLTSKTTSFPSARPPPTAQPPSASASSSSSSRKQRNEPRYNYVANPFDHSPDPDASSYRLVTARDLATRTTPPRRVKMLARDFIDDCLYNPNYGYFSTQAVIFDPDEATGTRLESGGYSEKAGRETGVAGVARGPGRRLVEEGRNGVEVGSADGVSLGRAEGFRFGEFGSTAEFEDEVARRYGAFEADGGEVGSVGKGPGRQVWHTPTELFKVSIQRQHWCVARR